MRLFSYAVAVLLLPSLLIASTSAEQARDLSEDDTAPAEPSMVRVRRAAADCITHSGITINDDHQITDFGENDWLTYYDVDFGKAGEMGQIQLRFASTEWDGIVEVRLGDQDGPVIGTFYPWNTGGWNNYLEAYFSIDADAIEGLHQVTFKGLKLSEILNLDWWELAPPVDPTDHNLHEHNDAVSVLSSSGVGIGDTAIYNFDSNDFVLYDDIWFGEEGDTGMISVSFAKGCCGGWIQVRLDGRYGPVLGTFKPWNTGGWDDFQNATFQIDKTISGLHRLCFVGFDSFGIWNFRSFQLAPPPPTPSPSLSPTNTPTFSTLEPSMVPSSMPTIDPKVFRELECNDGLSVDDCVPNSPKYHGTLTSLLNDDDDGGDQLQIPCGKCVDVDTTDGSTLSIPNGIDVVGMLYFPPSANLTLETTRIIVQGILKMDPPSTALANKVRVRLVGSEERILVPHPDNAMACDFNDCNIGKKAIAVAGGRLDIRGLEDETCPAWSKLKTIVPPSGFLNETTGCAIDYDMVKGDGTFSSYSVGTANPDGFYNVHADRSVVREDENGNKYLFQSADHRRIWNSGIGIVFQMQCVDPLSASNNRGRYRFGMRYRTHGGDGEGNGTPWLQIWGKGYNVPVSCPAAIDNEWVTCDIVVTLLEEHTNADSLNLQVHMLASPTKDVDIDDIKFEAIPTSHEIAVSHPRAAECWGARPNDEVLITYSGVGRTTWYHQVAKTIKSVDEGTGTITFAQIDTIGNPWRYNTMPASIDDLSESTKTMAAEIAWLSRPIVFEAELDGPSGNVHDALHGGHLMVMNTPGIAQHIEGVEIRHFGQQGEIGRYPIHIHMCGSVAGSILRKNVIRESRQRCVVIHGSHDVMIDETVAWDTYGHCFLAGEDGGEHGNTFLNNLGARTRYQELGIGSTDHLAATLWITNPMNHFIGNVAAGSAHNGIWFELEPIRGLSKSLPENEGVNPKYLPLLSFKGNTAHSCRFRAITTYHPGYFPSHEVVFEGTNTYHNNIGLMIHGTKNVRVKDSFFAINGLGLRIFEFQDKFGGVVIENSTFITNDCKAGIHSVELGQRDISLVVQSCHFSGYTCGNALLIDKNYHSKYYDMPIISNLTFSSDMVDVNPLSIRDESLTGNIFIEYHDDTLNQGGQPGFFVNNSTHMTAFIDEDLCIKSNGGLFCANTCFRRVIIDTEHRDDYQLIVTSQTDMTKSLVLDKSLWDEKKFDVVLPFDSYSVHFLRISTGEIMIPPFNLAFDDRNNGDDGVDPPLCDHITEESLRFECPQGYLLQGYYCRLSTPTISPAPVAPGYVWTRRAAVDCITHSGITINDYNKITDFGKNDWFTYYDVYFGKAGEVGQIRLRFASTKWNGIVEVRLGDQDGPVIGIFYPWHTGGWNNYVNAYFSIDADAIEGFHQVTFKGLDSSEILNLDWWELAPPVDPTDHNLYEPNDAVSVLASHGVATDGTFVRYFDGNDFVLYDDIWFGEEGDTGMISVSFAKGCCGGSIQVRLDGRYGPVLGTFNPWRTGGWDDFQDATFQIDKTISGLHRLCFLGLDSGGIWFFRSFQLAPPQPTLSPSPSQESIAPTTSSPTLTRTNTPTFSPTFSPSSSPTSAPTFSPSAVPTEIPSSSPSSNPSAGPSLAPSSAPSICKEKRTAEFFFKYDKDEDTVVTRTCAKLQKAKYDAKVRVCNLPGRGEVPSASEACPFTCGICGCFDDDEGEFLLKKDKSVTPPVKIMKDCPWLREKIYKKPGAAKQICKKKKKGGRKSPQPANVVCPQTCKTCVTRD